MRIPIVLELCQAKLLSLPAEWGETPHVLSLPPIDTLQPLC